VVKFYAEALAFRSADGRFRSYKYSGPTAAECKKIETIGIKGVLNTFGAVLVHLQDNSVVVWGSASHGGDISKVKHLLSVGVESVCANESHFAVVTCDGVCVSWGGYDGYMEASVPSDRMNESALSMMEQLSTSCKDGEYKCADSACDSVLDVNGRPFMKNICMGWCEPIDRLCKMMWNHNPSGLCHHHTQQRFHLDETTVAVEMGDAKIVQVDSKSTPPNSVHIIHKYSQWKNPRMVLACGVSSILEHHPINWVYVKLRSQEHLKQIIKKCSHGQEVRLVVLDHT
jgi:hypothetical protein